MATFSYQVDRVNRVLAPLTFNTTVELDGETVTLGAGDSVVYRGLVELGGKNRYVFAHGDRKLFSADRQALTTGLEENFDELVRP